MRELPIDPMTQMSEVERLHRRLVIYEHIFAVLDALLVKDDPLLALRGERLAHLSMIRSYKKKYSSAVSKMLKYCAVCGRTFTETDAGNGVFCCVACEHGY